MTKRRIEEIELVGGHVAIDFVNTVSNWNEAERKEYLADYEDLLRFGLRHGFLNAREAAHFRLRDDTERELALEEARRFRAHLYEIFLARAEDRTLPGKALGHVNALVRDLVQWREIRAQGSGICCSWRFENAPARAVLGPVVWEAADLLERGQLERIKACPGERCGWVFLDTSRNRSRQWCSMKACGNAAKVRRFRAKSGV